MENNIVNKPVDFSGKSVEDIVNYLTFEYLNIIDLDNDPNKEDFYCGITGDIDANLSRHNVAGYVACVLCDTYETASEVESRMGNIGFDIGNPNRQGQGGNIDSKIVYMIEKTDR